MHYTKLLCKNGRAGGERGGVSYILIRFIRCDSESTRLRTKGPGGLLTTNYYYYHYYYYDYYYYCYYYYYYLVVRLDLWSLGV